MHTGIAGDHEQIPGERHGRSIGPHFLPAQDLPVLVFRPRVRATDRLAFGIQGGLAYQPGADLAALFGVEASYSFLPGWALTAGYNILGFESNLGNQPTKQGVYLKLDLMLDEVKK